MRLHRIAPASALALALALALLPAARTQAADPLIYGGSGTIAFSILFDGALKAFEEKTGIRFDRFELDGGTTAGLRGLREGKVTVVGSSRPLSREEEAAGLVATLIGRDGNALYVNAENAVRGVTRAQAAGLLSGRIRTWKELGGKDEPVVLVLSPANTYGNCQESVRQALMGDAPLGKAGIVEGPPHDRLVAVATNTGALTPASNAGGGVLIEESNRGRIRELAIDGIAPTRENLASGAYPLARPLYLVTKGRPEGGLRLFLDFMLSAEGQAFVARGAIPLATAPASGGR